MTGGFGSRRCSRRSRRPDSTDAALREVPVRIIGIPGDRFVDHGSVSDLRRVLRLDAPGLADQVREAITALGATATASEAIAAGG